MKFAAGIGAGLIGLEVDTREAWAGIRNPEYLVFFRKIQYVTVIPLAGFADNEEDHVGGAECT